MKTAKSNRDEVRENSLVVPMTNEEKQAVQSAANNMGISMSAFARIVLKDFLKKSNN
jgi:urate oxidase